MKARFALLFLVVCAMSIPSCGSHLDEPEMATEVHDADGDSTMEKLTAPLWRFYGDKPDDVTRILYTYRQKGVYCIFPKTDARAQELQQLSQQEGSHVENLNGCYRVSLSRDFITGDDYVSDCYFEGYYNQEPDYVIICPTIIVKTHISKVKDILLSKYLGILTMADHFQGQREGTDYYMYYFDCNLSTSEQVLSLNTSIYWLDGVDWSEPDMYIRIHLQD